ncbi:MAG: DUF2281 domain-containing protein [Acidobacteriota bacterium]|nr:DUF2281 domain-containing protein [Acidobacteriota bacterium]
MQLDISELTPQVQTLLNNLQPGEEIIVTADDKPAFKLIPLNGHISGDVSEQPAKRKRRRAGTAKGNFWMSPDFNEPLEDFAEYMP